MLQVQDSEEKMISQKGNHLVDQLSSMNSWQVRHAKSCKKQMIISIPS